MPTGRKGLLVGECLQLVGFPVGFLCSCKFIFISDCILKKVSFMDFILASFGRCPARFPLSLSGRCAIKRLMEKKKVGNSHRTVCRFMNRILNWFQICRADRIFRWIHRLYPLVTNQPIRSTWSVFFDEHTSHFMMIAITILGLWHWNQLDDWHC